MADPLDYRLVFNLPPVFAFAVAPGRHQPCLAGCILLVNPAGQIEVTGPSRGAVFEQAARFLRMIGKGHDPVSIAAVLMTPAGSHAGAIGGRDSWSITVNARVSFHPTALPPEIFDDVGGRHEPLAAAPISGKPDLRRGRTLQLVR